MGNANFTERISRRRGNSLERTGWHRRAALACELVTNERLEGEHARANMRLIRFDTQLQRTICKKSRKGKVRAGSFAADHLQRQVAHTRGSTSKSGRALGPSALDAAICSGSVPSFQNGAWPVKAL